MVTSSWTAGPFSMNVIAVSNPLITGGSLVTTTLIDLVGERLVPPSPSVSVGSGHGGSGDWPKFGRDGDGSPDCWTFADNWFR